MSESKPRTIKRIVSFDAMRGGAVFAMIFVHTIMRMYDYKWISEHPENIASLPLFLVIIIAILGYFGMWMSFFILLSSSVNSYVMTKKMQKTTDEFSLLTKQLLSGSLILIVSFIKESFISGYLGTLIQTGSLPDSIIILRALYVMKPLSIIGWSIIINAFVLFLLIRKEGYKNYSRNIIIYIVLFIFSLTITPIMHSWGTNVIANNPEFSLKYSLASFLTGTNPGDNDPIFPYVATVFIGSIIGMSLAEKKPPKKLPLYGYLAGLTCLVVGVIMIILNIAVHFPDSLFQKPPELPVYLIFLAGQIALISLFLGKVEFKGNMEKFANNAIIKKFRVWSMISMTLFVLDIYDLVPRALLTFILRIFIPINLIKNDVFTGVQGFYWVTLAAIFVLLFYDLSIQLWRKINFIGSFEWIVIQIQNLVTKTKSHKLNVNYLLNEVTWIGFVSTIKKNSEKDVKDMDISADNYR